MNASVSPTVNADRNSPWYVEVFLAIGGWIAGLLAAIAIFAFAFAIVGDFKEDGRDLVAALIALTLGAGFILAGLKVSSGGKGDFRRHFSIAAIAAGLTAATGGVWYLLFKIIEPVFGTGGESEGIAAGISGLGAALALAAAGFFLTRRLRDGILTFLTTAAVYGAVFISITILSDKFQLSPDHFLPPLCAFLGAALFLDPRVGAIARPAGAALMLAPMAHFAIIDDLRFLTGTEAVAQTVVIFNKTALLAAALYCLSFLRGIYRFAPLAATALLAVAAVWLLPNAGGVAVIILLAGVAAGSRGLAIVGIVASAWFIGRFYYDLSMTLLVKSAVLAAMGAVMIAGALAFRRLAAGGARAAASGGERRRLLVIAGFGALLALSLGLVNRSVMTLETEYRDAKEILLALGPRDPRSLIQGDYMVLTYRNDIYPPQEAVYGIARKGQIFLKLDANRVATFSRLPVSGDVPRPDEVRIDYVRERLDDIRYAPDSYFFQEGDAEIYAGARFAILLVAPDGKARLIGLADENFQRLGAR